MARYHASCRQEIGTSIPARRLDENKANQHLCSEKSSIRRDQLHEEASEVIMQWAKHFFKTDSVAKCITGIQRRLGKIELKEK